MERLLNDPAALVALALLAGAIYYTFFRGRKVVTTAAPTPAAPAMTIREAIEAEEALEAKRMLNGLHSVKRYMEAETDRVSLAKGLLGSIKGKVDSAAEALTPNP